MGVEVGTNEVKTGNGRHGRDILEMSAEAVERANQNHLNFQRDCMYLELTHSVL